MSVEPLLAASRDKLKAALELLFASVDDYSGFDPGFPYTPKQREPYDALSDRIAHEYLPEELARIYEAIVTESARELRRLHGKLGEIA